jgi:hypothetical protein
VRVGDCDEVREYDWVCLIKYHTEAMLSIAPLVETVSSCNIKNSNTSIRAGGDRGSEVLLKRNLNPK